MGEAEVRWRGRPAVALVPEVGRVLMAAVMEWVGLHPSAEELDARTEETLAMIDGAGSFGVRNWRGRLLRTRTEAWARGVIEG